MNKIHRIRKKSLFFQVFLIVGIIFTSTLILNNIQDIFRERIYRESQKLMKVSICFNDITVKLQILQDGWKLMLDNLDTEKGKLETEDILDDSEQLTEYLNEEKYNRSSIDLYYTIETYIEECQGLESAIQGKDFTEIASKTIGCTQNYEFAQDRLNQVYKDIQKQYTVSGEQMELYEKWLEYVKISSVLITFCMSLFLLIVLNRTIIHPVNSLSKSAKKFTLEGKVGPTIFKTDVRNEISELNNNISQMQERICDQYGELLQKAELEKKLHEDEIKMIENEKWLKEAQLRNLQARINPHFLFNSINLISRMAYMENAEHTSEMLESFGEFLRYNLDNFGKVVSMEKEIENIKDYVEIQKIRFGDRIDFIINEDEKARKVKVPCLILQPLVENAIVHGVGMYINQAMVSVDVRKLSDTQVRIIILDNGVGMTPEKLEEIRSKTVESVNVQEENSIGLANVFKRLRLFFNNEVKIKIDSEEKKFTKIQIIIPFKKEGES